MLDPIAIDRAEASIDQFIEKRAQQDRAEEERDDLWQASVRRYNGQRQQANLVAWLEYHQAQKVGHQRTLEMIVHYHETEERRYREMLEARGDVA